MREAFNKTSARVAAWLYILTLGVLGLDSLTNLPHGGELGVLAAIACLGILVVNCVYFFPGITRRLLPGIVFAGVIQFIPFLHLRACSLALSTWEFAIGGQGNFSLGNNAITKEIGGFVVTILTGQQLLFVAMLFGSFVCWIRDFQKGGDDIDDGNYEHEPLN